MYIVQSARFGFLNRRRTVAKCRTMQLAMVYFAHVRSGGKEAAFIVDGNSGVVIKSSVQAQW